MDASNYSGTTQPSSIDGQSITTLPDASNELSPARLRRLSEEINRIAATLMRLSAAPGISAVSRKRAGGNNQHNTPMIRLEAVSAVIRARQLRAQFFDPELFADPAWDMLLDLFRAELAHHRVSVSSLCIAASVPTTTALRWIKMMADAGIFRRQADSRDHRRVFLELSPEASDAIRNYFIELGEHS